MLVKHVPGQKAMLDMELWNTLKVLGSSGDRAKMKPFVLTAPSQFRPGPPPTLTSSTYVQDLEEVRLYGGKVSTAGTTLLRTPEQTEVALFWQTNGVIQYNEMFRAVAQQRGLGLLEASRLFAMGNLIGTDSMVAAFDATYHYGFWRPWSAIQRADEDDSSITVPDTAWTHLAMLPNHPEYVAARTTFASAIAEMLTAFLGTRAIDISLSSTPTMADPAGARTRAILGWALMRTPADQLDHLVELGVPEAIGIPAARLRELAAPAVARAADHPAGEAVLVLGRRIAAAAALLPLLNLGGRPGFVVPDMTDLAEFADIDGLGVPDAEVYAVVGVERGDDLADWTPDAALPEILARGRTPLTVHEGICWLLQEPGLLERNHCFMTVGSRKRTGAALDRRVPALWISGGAERDGGRARRGAPKLGWCWAGNRHTWLGFASGAARIG